MEPWNPQAGEQMETEKEVPRKEATEKEGSVRLVSWERGGSLGAQKAERKYIIKKNRK